MNATPKAIILAGYGLNCEEETARAFALAGVNPEIVHLADVIENPKQLSQVEILAIPGGFSFGDHTGSGRAYANKLKNHLGEVLQKFTERDTLTLGICNGFQILTHVGLLPGALTHNTVPRYQDRWVDLQITGASPWLKNIETLSVPIAHGEGRYQADEQIIAELKHDQRIAAQYTEGEISDEFSLPANPNGSVEDIAGVLGSDGRVLGMMPHPERALFFTQLPHWPRLKEVYRRSGKKLPEYAGGLQLFKNAQAYFG